MKKKILSLLLCIVMCLSLMPTVAFAGEDVTEYDLWVSGVQVTFANKNDVLNDGGKVSYDPATKTLIVRDSANITDTYDGALIYAEGINLTISAPNGLILENNAAGYGILVWNGDLTINGNVNITVSKVGADAICAVFGSVNIGGDAVVQFNGTATENGYDAINANKDLVIAGDATVRGFKNGLYADKGNITVKGSAKIETIAYAMYAYGYNGIEVGKDVTITVSEVGANAIYAHNGSVNIGGNATVQFNGAETESGYEAIYANKELTIGKDATVTGSFTYGLFAENGSVNMTDGKWDISAKEMAIRGLSGITIPETHKITTPTDGKIEKIAVNADSSIPFEYSTVTASDGTTVAGHAVIEPETVNCTVTFEMNGHGDLVADQTVKEGEKATKPTDPTASGWTFGGWYADAACTTAFNFDTVINADTAIYAKWTKNSSGSGGSSSGGSSSSGGGTYAGPTTSTTTVVKPALTMELQIGNKDYKVNNKTYTYDVAPFIAGDRTMVPVRVIMETLGAKVDWNEAARSVTITLDGKVMTMTIGKEIPGYGSAPIIRDSRTYVPIRYIMENTGAKVDWIAATGEIIITK